MYLLAPGKVRLHSKLNFDTVSSQRLDICVQFQLRKLMNQFVDCRAHLLVLNDVTDLLFSHIVKMLPSQMFLVFYPLYDLLLKVGVLP